jgi:hypothetical protein
MYFHNLLINQFELLDKIRFKIPFYYGKSWICYLNPLKNGKVELAFIRGNELSNEQALLDNKGRKQVFGIEFETITDIPHQSINEIIKEALALDDMIAYESKRKKRPKKMD